MSTTLDHLMSLHAAAVKAACDVIHTLGNEPDNLDQAEINAAAAQCALRTALAEALRDSDRIDELERLANLSGGILLHNGAERGRRGIGLRPGMLQRTLRQAVDDAMKETTNG